MENSNLIELNIFGDERGSLVAIESQKIIPFEIKRVFYIFGTQEKLKRGCHAHYKTKQFLISVSGSCKVSLDNGVGKEIYNLNRPNLGLMQAEMVWGEMYDFSHDSVLMVLADNHYEKSDYIMDYQEFMDLVHRDSLL